MLIIKDDHAQAATVRFEGGDEVHNFLNVMRAAGPDGSRVNIHYEVVGNFAEVRLDRPAAIMAFIAILWRGVEKHEGSFRTKDGLLSALDYFHPVFFALKACLAEPSEL